MTSGRAYSCLVPWVLMAAEMPFPFLFIFSYLTAVLPHSPHWWFQRQHVTWQSALEGRQAQSYVFHRGRVTCQAVGCLCLLNKRGPSQKCSWKQTLPMRGPAQC